MNVLIIESTDSSPKVILDPIKNIFSFSGESRPENSSKFFTPIIHWLEEYQKILYWEKEKSSSATVKNFEFKLDYFNSTSAKFIMDILIQLDKMAIEGYPIKATWYYDKRDEDMKESGEEFARLLKKIPIEFIEA